MGQKISKELLDSMIDLRVNHRKSIKDIRDILGISVSTVSKYLKNIRLTEEELLERRLKGLCNRKKFDNGDISKFSSVLNQQPLYGGQKGRISESAILYRLAIYGLEIYQSCFSGGKIDFIVYLNGYNKLAKIQVKTVALDRQISMRCTSGRNKYRRYNNNEFDFLVGYDIMKDNAYVYSSNIIKKFKSRIAIREDAKENWECIIDFLKG